MESLALRYRPKTWEDVLGQETSVRIIKAMLERGRLYPFFVFGGPRAAGKTSMARILAKAVNCLSPVDYSPCNVCEICLSIDDESCPDFMELDAASNGGIASVRKIKDISMYTPSMLKHRVFVLDEAHAMSREAFQAMLKILEEPPPRTIFIMATTEVQEIPETILSRAFPFEFKRIQPVDIAGRLRMIADCESLDVEDSALMAIAANVSGAVRDAITLLQQVSALPGRVTEDDVLAVLGVLKRSEIADAVEFMINKKAARVVIWLGQLRTKGVSPFVVLEALLDYSNVLLASSVGVSSGLSVAEQDRAYLLCQQLGPERLDRLVEHISTISVRASRAQRFAQLLVDTGLTRIAREGAL